MVTFFTDPKGACPVGWTEALYGRGRLIMGTTNPKKAGREWGTPFSPADPPRHRHSLTYWNPKDVFVHRDQKLFYDNSGPPAMIFDHTFLNPISGQSEESTLNLPFMQMVLCEQTEDGGALLDTMPVNTVAFFSGDSCPVRGAGFEWVPYEKANERFIVPLVASGEAEKLVGSGLPNGPYLHHGHSGFNTLSVKDIGGEKGKWCYTCGETHFIRSDKSLTISIETDGSSDAIPYREMMVCRKAGTRRLHKPLPPPLITFFRAAKECEDYLRAPTTGGRFLVGLPEKGEPNRAFGEALANGETRRHTHVAPPFIAKAQRVDVGAGHAFKDIAVQVESKVALPPSGPQIPYIQLVQCWSRCPKCSAEALPEGVKGE